MGVLIAVVIGLSMLGCYEPALRDCTVTCDQAADCAGDQVCGRDGLCAAPEVAGKCSMRPVEAMPPDARPDGPVTIKLHVRVDGKGSIVVDGYGTCSSGEPQRGDCMYDIVLGVPQRARAISITADEVFEAWTTGTCKLQPETCTFTPLGATSITAKFGHP